MARDQEDGREAGENLQSAQARGSGDRDDKDSATASTVSIEEDGGVEKRAD